MAVDVCPLHLPRTLPSAVLTAGCRTYKTAHLITPPCLKHCNYFPKGEVSMALGRLGVTSHRGSLAAGTPRAHPSCLLCSCSGCLWPPLGFLQSSAVGQFPYTLRLRRGDQGWTDTHLLAASTHFRLSPEDRGRALALCSQPNNAQHVVGTSLIHHPPHPCTPEVVDVASDPS